MGTMRARIGKRRESTYPSPRGKPAQERVPPNMIAIALQSMTQLKRMVRYCASLLLLCSSIHADGSAEIILADPTTQSASEWTRHFMERSREVYLDATARCAKEGKVAITPVWQNSTLQIVTSCKCLYPDDPALKAVLGGVIGREITPTQAEKVCAAQGKKAEKTKLDSLTFYICSSPSDEVAKPDNTQRP